MVPSSIVELLLQSVDFWMVREHTHPVPNAGEAVLKLNLLCGCKRWVIFIRHSN
jgi:hypothetical protein